MKLAFSTLGCPDWGFNDIFTTAKDLGYDAVEVRGIDREIYAPKIGEFSDEKIEETKNKLSSMGIKISMLTSAAALAIFNERERSLKEAMDYIDLAKKLSVPYIRIMSTDKPYFDGGDITQCKKLFEKVVDYCENSSVTPLMETNGLFVDTAALKDFLDDVGGKSGALWDVHHPYRFGGESIEKSVENLSKYIKYIHIKDSIVLNGRTSYKMMGYGDIPIDRAIKALDEIEFDGYYSLEWVKRWNRDLEEPGIVFAHYKNYMNRF